MIRLAFGLNVWSERGGRVLKMSGLIKWGQVKKRTALGGRCWEGCGHVHSLLDMQSLRCLWGIQGKISNRFKPKGEILAGTMH